jgi:hypothetical protein
LFCRAPCSRATIIAGRTRHHGQVEKFVVVNPSRPPPTAYNSPFDAEVHLLSLLALAAVLPNRYGFGCSDLI